MQCLGKDNMFLNFCKKKNLIERTMPVYIFLLLTINRDCAYLLQMLKFNHVYNLVDLRLHFKPPSRPFMLKRDIKTLQDMLKFLGIGKSTSLRGHFHLFGKKMLNKREREAGSCWDKSYYNWKNKCCLPTLNISMKKDFDTDVLFN